MKRLKGKVIVVTGAGRGIAKAAVEKMVNEGASVIINDVSQEHLDVLEGSMLDLGGDVLSIKSDVTKPEQVESMISAAIDKYNQIDVLVNNVGGTYACTKRFLDELDDEDWYNMLDLNLSTTFLCSKAVLPYMRKKGKGKIINISSLAAVIGEPLIWSPPYAAAKAAVLGLTRQLAIEQGPYGITANAIAQADVLTERTYDHLAGDAWPETEEEMLDRFTRYPLGRLAEPEDVANVIFFLASDDSSFVNGETVMVGGGQWFG